MRPVLPCLIPLTLATAASAQFDQISYPAGSSVTLEDGLVAVDDGTDLSVFSSFGQTFLPFATSGGLLGSGAHVLYALDANDNRIAYSARRHEVAKLIVPAGSTIIEERVEGDVILVLMDNGVTLDAYGYSAWTNVWDTFPLDVASLAADEIVTADYALGLVNQTANGDQLLGFGARLGTWIPSALAQDAGSLLADGNVVAGHWEDALAARVIAFSGVHSTWELSSAGADSTTLQVDHNVAYVEASGGGGSFRGEAYSAYETTWLQSAVSHAAGSTVLHLNDNWVGLEVPQGAFASQWEAIGARRLAGGWVPLAGLLAAELVSTKDGITVDAGTGALFGFSGMFGDIWQAEAVALPVVPEAPSDGALLLARDSVDVSHVFDCARGLWAPPFLHNGSGDTNLGTASALAFDNATNRVSGYSTRFGAWVLGPLAAAPTARAAHGSLSSLVQTAGGGIGDSMVWDTRRDQFSSLQSFGGSTDVTGTSELALFAGPSDTWMYSVRRGLWEEVMDSAGPVGGIAAGSFEVADEVGYVIANGELIALGSAGDTHAWASYPEGTEYHLFGALGGIVPTTPVHSSLRATTGDFVGLFVDSNRLPAGIALGANVAGLLHLPAPTLLFAVPPILTDNLHSAQTVGPGSGVTQVWLQSVTRTPAFFPPFALALAPEPVLIH